MPTATYRTPTLAHIKRFKRVFDKIVGTVERTHPEDIHVKEVSDETHFRDTDIGARIEWTDGKMIYWIVMDARRLQDHELESGRIAS